MARLEELNALSRYICRERPEAAEIDSEKGRMRGEEDEGKI